MTAFIGCAGWSIRREHQAFFAGEGKHLERYARVFSCVEINSSFYRPHRAKTYSSWAASVPQFFRFSVKMPRVITHEKALRSCADELQKFVGAISGLETKLGPILVQLPPSLAFESLKAGAFFEGFRKLHPGSIVLEPRHRSWFSDESANLLRRYAVGFVAADPAPTHDQATHTPSASEAVSYWRLHGSPQMYHSSYSQDYLTTLAIQMRTITSLKHAWCIFDNTARGAAIDNAMYLHDLMIKQDGVLKLHDRKRSCDFSTHNRDALVNT